MNILNLTQHTSTIEQVSEAVFEPSEKGVVQTLLTFNTIPTKEELETAARTLAGIATEEGAKYAMIGGAPFFMAPLEAALRTVGIVPIYAFSVRESIDQPQEDGSIKKVAVFRHKGFVGL